MDLVWYNWNASSMCNEVQKVLKKRVSIRNLKMLTSVETESKKDTMESHSCVKLTCCMEFPFQSFLASMPTFQSTVCHTCNNNNKITKPVCCFNIQNGMSEL